MPEAASLEVNEQSEVVQTRDGYILQGSVQALDTGF